MANNQEASGTVVIDPALVREKRLPQTVPVKLPSFGRRVALFLGLARERRPVHDFRAADLVDALRTVNPQSEDDERL